MADGFTALVASLRDAIGDATLSLHVGVVSTDLGAGPYNVTDCSGEGDRGVLQAAPRVEGCAPPDGAFIRDVVTATGERQSNHAGDLGAAFSCISQLGGEGCGFEQPLEAMRRALDGSNPENAGFLREESALIVVIVSDEDDCSTEDTQMFDTSQNSTSDPLGPFSSYRCFEFGVEHDGTDWVPREDSPYMFPVGNYVDFLANVHTGRTAVALLVGPPEPVMTTTDSHGHPAVVPSCSSDSGEAAPGIRHYALGAGLFEAGGGALFGSICDDIGSQMAEIGRTVGENL